MSSSCTGQYYDEETNLHYNYFRDYDPTTGWYIQSDPIGLGGGLNTYGYVGGNPVIYFDPLGLTKGGKQNISTEGFNKNSNPKDVKKALKDALSKNQPKRVSALRALLKVIKRGGTMGIAPSLIIDDALRDSCASGDLSHCRLLCLFFPEEKECQSIISCQGKEI